MKKVVKFLTQHINAVAIGQLVVDIDMVPQFRKTRIDMSFLYATLCCYIQEALLLLVFFYASSLLLHKKK